MKCVARAVVWHVSKRYVATQIIVSSTQTMVRSWSLKIIAYAVERDTLQLICRPSGMLKEIPDLLFMV